MSHLEPASLDAPPASTTTIPPPPPHPSPAGSPTETDAEVDRSPSSRTRIVALFTEHQGTARERVESIIRDRIGNLPGWVLITQLFIGLGWVRAASEKFIDINWWTGVKLLDFLDDHDGQAIGWYQPFLDLVVEPGAVAIAMIVLVLQAGVGAALVSGRYVGGALGVGMFLNLHFLAAGAVDPSAFYLLAQGSLALWLAERRWSLRTSYRLRATAIGGAVLGLASIPFIRTLHPSGVIEDPAILMVTGALLGVIGCDVAHRRISGGAGLP